MNTRKFHMNFMVSPISRVALTSVIALTLAWTMGSSLAQEQTKSTTTTTTTVTTTTSDHGHDHDHGHTHNAGPVKVTEAELSKPTPTPDRIILSITVDPRHSQAVSWRTDVQTTRGVAQIKEAEDGPGIANEPATVKGTMQRLDSKLSSAIYHQAMFDGLKPNTKYAYRVGDGVNWSEWFQFRTASDKPEPFSFIYFGDAQNDIKSMWSRIIREAYSDAPKARLMIHAGDLVNHGPNDAQWGEWFGAGGWLNGMVPNLPTPGNHEYRLEEADAPKTEAKADAPKAEAKTEKKADAPKTETKAATETKTETKAEPSATAKLLAQAKAVVKDTVAPAQGKLTDHWRAQFALPDNGPKGTGLEESVYYVDFQGVRFVSLNSNEQQELQAKWLDEVLTNNPNMWTIVTYHHPMYSVAKARDNSKLRELWQPIFDKHHVDLALQGHDHSYARSGLVVGNQNVNAGANVRDPRSGTVYVVSVSGPKMYEVDKNPIFKRTAEQTQLYQILHVNGSTIRYEARTARGELYDAFELRKQDGKPNQLIEQAPNTPERLFDPPVKKD